MSADAEEFQQLMMSRLNWMTYLKLLFDKLNQISQVPAQNLQQSTSSHSSSNEVDVYYLLDALS